ncbi:MAG: hypothetical protein DRR19_00310 [Candidatus Parabeggiatoa sp. nov. 1]|nr:MAG: hypothetical protein DRR19_00310 [Gammaproteobacteria bacterium]
MRALKIRELARLLVGAELTEPCSVFNGSGFLATITIKILSIKGSLNSPASVGRDYPEVQTKALSKKNRQSNRKAQGKQTDK